MPVLRCSSFRKPKLEGARVGRWPGGRLRSEEHLRQGDRDSDSRSLRELEVQEALLVRRGGQLLHRAPHFEREELPDLLRRRLLRRVHADAHRRGLTQNDGPSAK